MRTAAVPGALPMSEDVSTLPSIEPALAKGRRSGAAAEGRPPMGAAGDPWELWAGAISGLWLLLLSRQWEQQQQPSLGPPSPWCHDGPRPAAPAESPDSMSDCATWRLPMLQRRTPL